jgi:hypothetical protein
MRTRGSLPTFQFLCRAAATVLPVDSTAISVYLGGEVAVPMGTSDAAVPVVVGSAVAGTGRGPRTICAGAAL